MNRPLFLGVLLLLGASTAALAERFRYIDQSGNIVWVDHVSQIPPQYRQQIYKPTPIPSKNQKRRGPKPKTTEQLRKEELRKEKRKKLEEIREKKRLAREKTAKEREERRRLKEERSAR